MRERRRSDDRVNLTFVLPIILTVALPIGSNGSVQAPAMLRQACDDLDRINGNLGAPGTWSIGSGYGLALGNA